MKQHGKQAKKDSEQNTKKNDHFCLKIPADIRRSLNLTTSEITSPETTSISSSTTPITQSPSSKTTSISSSTTSIIHSDPIPIQNIRLPTNTKFRRLW
ncbi:11453_t:CDS:2 [Funneliformis caledonium]|uniref:11453_t:CDS:1 n=1 Tax=Funneliformis caledonium TaxID=1117310 RepID=A0A9N9NE25_9GLOM|nr:11453_t:CDS:2 [Funneliformis caledonium]